MFNSKSNSNNRYEQHEHCSVLASEVMGCFFGRQLRFVVDGTLGAGGHSELLLQQHPEIELLVGIDQDPLALTLASKRLMQWKEKIKFLHGNFSDLKNHLTKASVSAADAIVLDLGVSSMQLDRAERGFSFMREGPLDMRMNPDTSLDAMQVVNDFSESDLGRIFREYGEEKQWRAAAKLVAEARATKKIETTSQLSEILMPLLGWKRSRGSQPLALIFQGLRIFVNRELEVLKKVLPEAIDLLAPQGRVAIITFHSLEDRLVKEAFRFAASDKEDSEGLGSGLFLDKAPLARIVTRRPILPTEEEIDRNPRSRSAKLRVLEKIANPLR